MGIIPDHQFAFNATQRIGRRWLLEAGLSVSSNYLSPIFDNNTFVSRAYQFHGIHRIDFGGGYRLPIGEFRAARFFGKVENLLDQSYFESGFRVPGVVGRGGMQFEF